MHVNILLKQIIYYSLKLKLFTCNLEILHVLYSVLFYKINTAILVIHISMHTGESMQMYSLVYYREKATFVFQTLMAKMNT